MMLDGFPAIEAIEQSQVDLRVVVAREANVSALALLFRLDAGL